PLTLTSLPTWMFLSLSSAWRGEFKSTITAAAATSNDKTRYFIAHSFQKAPLGRAFKPVESPAKRDSELLRNSLPNADLSDCRRYTFTRHLFVRLAGIHDSFEGIEGDEELGLHAVRNRTNGKAQRRCCGRLLPGSRRAENPECLQVEERFPLQLLGQEVPGL